MEEDFLASPPLVVEEGQLFPGVRLMSPVPPPPPAADALQVPHVEQGEVSERLYHLVMGYHGEKTHVRQATLAAVWVAVMTELGPAGGRTLTHSEERLARWLTSTALFIPRFLRGEKADDVVAGWFREMLRI